MGLPIRLNVERGVSQGAVSQAVKSGPVKAVQQLYQQIRQGWNERTPEQLAGQIIDLEGRVARLSGSTPGLAKMQGKVEEVHFQFVFPIVLELKRFAKTVSRYANQVLKTNSASSLQHLNATQRGEVKRHLEGG